MEKKETPKGGGSCGAGRCRDAHDYAKSSHEVGVATRATAPLDNELAAKAGVGERTRQQRFVDAEREKNERKKRDEEERERVERRRRDVEEWTSERYVRTNMKNCVGCGWWTERVDGCKHMTCKLLPLVHLSHLDTFTRSIRQHESAVVAAR